MAAATCLPRRLNQLQLPRPLTDSPTNQPTPTVVYRVGSIFGCRISLLIPSLFSFFAFFGNPLLFNSLCEAGSVQVHSTRDSIYCCWQRGENVSSLENTEANNLLTFYQFNRPKMGFFFLLYFGFLFIVVCCCCFLATPYRMRGKE